MRIKCHATETGHGVFISGIETEDDAASLRSFFRERGPKPIGPPADCQILLVGLNMEQFTKLIEGANIEFV